MSPKANSPYQLDLTDSSWKLIYKLGSIAVLMAVILFRRYLAVELVTFNGFGIFDVPQEFPDSAIEWFNLFQKDRILGLVLFEAVDLINYALVGFIFLALYGALRTTNHILATTAAIFGLVGITVYFASNQAFSMDFLSQKYAAAGSEQLQALNLTAGEALLAVHNPGGIYQGTGIYISLFLVLLSGLLFSIVMLNSTPFGKTTAVSGLLANGIGLCYFITLALIPELLWLPPSLSALFRMGWYILIAINLIKLGWSKQ